MTARTYLNLGLGIIIVTLVLVVIYEPGIEKPREPQKLSQLTVNEIKHISVEKDDKVSIVLDKLNDGWHISQPYQMPANEFRVQSLLQLTIEKSYAQYPANEHDLKKFKLDKPQIRVHLGDLTVSFGDTEPLTLHRYVLANNTIHLVDDNIYHQVIRNAVSFISNDLLPNDKEIVALATENFQLHRKDTDKPWVITPAASTASADTINELLDEWRHAQALDVQTYVGEKPAQKVSIKFNKGDTIQFDILSKQPELVLGRADIGIEYHLTGDSYKKLFELRKPEQVSE